MAKITAEFKHNPQLTELDVISRYQESFEVFDAKTKAQSTLKFKAPGQASYYPVTSNPEYEHAKLDTYRMELFISESDDKYFFKHGFTPEIYDNNNGYGRYISLRTNKYPEEDKILDPSYKTRYINTDFEMLAKMSYPGSLFNKAGSSESYIYGTIFDRAYLTNSVMTLAPIGNNSYKLSIDYNGILKSEVYDFSATPIKLAPYNTFNIGSLTEERHPTDYDTVYVWTGLGVSNEDIYIRGNRHKTPNVKAIKEFNRIVWDKCETANSGYTVYRDGTPLLVTNDLFYNIPEADINSKHYYQVKVNFNTTPRVNNDLTELYAYNADPNKYGIYHANVTIEAFKESALSDRVYLYKLATPTNLMKDRQISYNSVSIKWDEVPNATGYRIYLDDSEVDISEFSEYRLSKLTISNHTAKVQAITLNDEAIESEISDPISFSVSKLAVPMPYIADAYGNADPNGEYLSWKEYDTDVNKPTGYIVNDSLTDQDIVLNTVSNKVYRIDALTTKLDNGVHNFTVRAVVLNENSEVLEDWSSDWSDPVSFSVNTLATPSIAFVMDDNFHLTSNITWTEIANASSYNIYVNDSLLTSVTETHYEGLNNALGNIPNPNEKLIYKIQVNAVSNTVKLEDSAKSNIIEYYVAKLMAPTITQLSTAGLLKWNAITTPEIAGSEVPEIKYNVYHNNILTPNSPMLELETQLNITPGLTTPNSAYLNAICTNQALVNPNPKYIQSENSETAAFGKFSKPYNLRTAEDGYLYWDVNKKEEEFIEQYLLYNNGEPYFTSSTARYKIPTQIPQTFNFSVKVQGVDSLGGSGGIVASDISNTLTVIINKLEAPKLLINTVEKYISWNYIDGADFYDVYLNGNKINSTTANRFSFKELEFVSEGINIFNVIARSNGVFTLESNSSNYVEYRSVVAYTAYVRIKEKGILSKPIPIEMPLSIQQKRDDSLDTAVVTLLLNNKKKPYSPYTDIEISLASETGDTYKTWYMLVSNDNVQEKPVGKKRLYSHTIQCVGRTRFLQTVIVPNMAVTQPEDYIYRGYAYDEDIVIPNFGGNHVFDERTGIIRSNTKSLKNVFITSGIYANIIGNVKRSMNEFFKFSLPYVKGSYVESLIMKSGFWQAIKYLFTGKLNIYKYKKTPITLRWFIRKHDETATDQYIKRLDNEEVEIASYTINDGDQRPSFSFINSDYYKANKDVKLWDLILTIDDVPSASYVEDKNASDGYRLEDLKLMFSKEVTEDLPENIREAVSNNGITTTDVTDTSYRVVYSGINVSSVNIIDVSPHITVADALQKLCDISNNIKTTDKAKYSIDPVIIDLTKGIPCYQLKFEGKSLYECLETLGKEFFGVPYLVRDTNMISFHILDESNIISKQSNEELMTTESSMDNCSTGFITDASNIISTNNIEVYPGNNMWITPRSTDATTPFITVSNCGLVIDKPIAYLKDVEVTGFDNGGTIVSIKPNIYEKSFYDALSANRQGKGSSLYWQIGDNKIYGLGVIPEIADSKFQAALGLKNTTYVIQNILYDITGIKPADEKIKDLKFRVTYIPYNNTNIITEQFNTSDYERLSYKAYNQTDAIISDTAFGSATNKEIQRLGNNSIYKSISVGNINQCPVIGDAMMINNELYYANVINYEFLPSILNCVIEYTKDYNKINDRMGINSDYREYEIYNSDYVNRTININHYCYLSTKEDIDNVNDATKTGNWPLIVDNALKGTPINTLEQFYITVYGNKNGSIAPLTYRDFGGTERVIDYGIALHATRLDMRNSILFTAKMEDNFSAGNKANKENATEGMYSNDYVRYVDEQGRLYAANIALGNPTINQLYGDNYSNTAQYEYPKCNRLSGDLKYKIDDCVLNETYLIDKDNREALTFTYQMHMKSDEKPYKLHKGLSKYLFKNNDENRDLGNAIIVGYKGVIKSKESLRYNKDDVLGFVTTEYTPNGTLFINEMNVTTKYSYDGFAVVYKNGDIVFSYEMPIKSGTPITLPATYFNFKDKTLK